MIEGQLVGLPFFKMIEGQLVGLPFFCLSNQIMISFIPIKIGYFGLTIQKLN